MEALKILILEDSHTDAELIQRLLKKTKPECVFHLAMHKDEFLKALDGFSPDVILSDNSLPQFNALEALKIVRQRSIQIPFILVTGTVSDEFAAEIIKHGADDYILKDRMVRLPTAIDAALKQRQLEKEKLEATDKLIQSEEKYRTIFSKSPLPTWIYDPETLRFLEVNEAAIRHYGYSYDKFLSMTIKDIRPKEDIEPLLKEVKKMHLRSDAQQGIWRHLKKNGEVIIVETTAHAIDYGNKKVRMVIANDITEKIVAKEELSRNELRFRTLTSNAPVGIFQTDAKGKTIYVNETWMKYTGLTFDDAMGDAWIKVLHPDDKEKQIKQWQDKLQSGLESSSEFRVLDKKGNTRWVIGKATPFFDKNQQLTGYIGTLSDITENKKAEELETKLLEQQKQEQVKITATALEAQEKERNDIGVELHDNVNQILVGTKLLLSTVKEVSDRNINVLAACMKNLQDAIDENRKIAHALVTPDLDTDTLADQIKRLTTSMLKPAGVKSNVDVSNYEEKLLNKERKIAIYRIAQEQCTNIVKYANASEVSIVVRNNNSHFTMIIADDGSGMDEGIETMGIGLRNINSRLSIFNGQANIITAPGKGFTLEIEIPL